MRGSAWMFFQAVGMKVFSFLGQLVLAWLLAPDDFGRVSLVYGLTGIALLIQNFGLSDVLISRSSSFSLWQQKAQSLSVVVALVSWIVVIGFGLGGSILYHDLELFYLIAIYSLAIPFNALNTVADGKLRIDLRFKELSFIQVAQVFFTQLLTILLAFFEFGVYSFVIPPVLVAFGKYLYCHQISHVSLFFRYSLVRTRYLIVNSSWGFVYSATQRVTQQFDYLILGLFVDKGGVGLYYMAYSLSVQVIGLLVNSLVPALFPTLSGISKQDSNQVRQIMFQMFQVMAMIGMPFAFLQVIVARPLVQLLLSEKWLPSIPLVEILSVGIGFHIMSSLWAVSMRIRSDFKGQAMLSIYGTMFFLLVVSIFTYYSGERGTAWAVTVYHVIVDPVFICVAFMQLNIPPWKILVQTFKYTVLSGVIFSLIYYLSDAMAMWIQLAIRTIMAPTIYFVVLYFMDAEFRLFFQKVKNLLMKRMNQYAA